MNLITEIAGGSYVFSVPIQHYLIGIWQATDGQYVPRIIPGLNGMTIELPAVDDLEDAKRALAERCSQLITKDVEFSAAEVVAELV